jgi:hypothetical protein
MQDVRRSILSTFEYKVKANGLESSDSLQMIVRLVCAWERLVKDCVDMRETDWGAVW